MKRARRTTRLARWSGRTLSGGDLASVVGGEILWKPPAPRDETGDFVSPTLSPLCAYPPDPCRS